MIATNDHAPTITVDDVVRDLMNYFAAIGAASGRTFSIRDFHSQVMMNAYAPQDRDCLDPALASLCDAGVLERASATEYVLTPTGLARVKALRASRG